VTGLLERLGVELPVLQAGMAGGIAGHELAAAVSEAGGLGTLGLIDPAGLRRELAAARERTSRPVAVNMLLPFARAAHWKAAAAADAVVTFWGRPRRRTETPWLHQCGSVEESRAAHAAGADGVIVQGVEAGGHVAGAVPALELLDRVRRALPAGFPVLVAGGIAVATDVAAALDAGATAAVLGTRFLMTPESRAHPGYRDRVGYASETILTGLFGLGWPALHRVVPNQATRRWLKRGAREPFLLRALNQASRPLRHLGATDAAPLQRPGLPLFSPQPPVDGHPYSVLDAAPLYAGETALRIDDVRPAGALTLELAGKAP
jgi:nitronate monooxygenase